MNFKNVDFVAFIARLQNAQKYSKVPKRNQNFEITNKQTNEFH